MCWRPVSKPSDWNMRLREVTSQALAGISSSQWSYEGEGPTRGKVPQGSHGDARARKHLGGVLTNIHLPTSGPRGRDRCSLTLKVLERLE